MNKTKIISSLILLSTLITPTFTTSLSVNASEDIELSTEVVTKLKTTLNNPYQIDSRLTFSYPYDLGSVVLPYLDITDQTSTTNRVHLVKYEGLSLIESYIKKGNNGNAYKYHLTISNTVGEIEMLDEKYEAISFDKNYSSPFINFVKLSTKQINSYFDVKFENNEFILTANDKAYGSITSSFNIFFNEYDLFPWDVSVVSTIDNFKLYLNEEGTPTKMSFDKVKKDIYGGIITTFNSTFTSINNVETLKPYASTLDQDASDTFIDNISNFQSKINLGNFTEQVNIGGFTYSNYYQLDKNVNDNVGPMMMTDNILYAQGYGETYVGVVKSGSEYVRIGVSPEEGFSDRLDSSSYSSITELIPHFSKISPDFFTFEDGIYTFDIANFHYADFEFSVDLLDAIVGLVDTMVSVVGIYLDDGIDYNFQKLEMIFDSNNYPVCLLTFANGGQLYQALFAFKDVGTTDLTKVSSIAPAIQYLSNN